MSAPVLVFLHGALNDHEVWNALADHFAGQGWRVLAPDLPGHGAAGTPLASVEAMADWLLATFDREGVAQAALVGHSMGSLVALEAAARAPERVTHLALLGSTWPMKVSGTLLKAALEDEGTAIDMVAGWSHPPGAQQRIEASRALMRRVAAANPVHLLHNDLAACKAYANGAQAAGAVRCPVLFLSGAQDVMTPPAGATALVAALPAPALVQVDAGHQLMADEPDGVRAALAHFLDEPAQRQSTGPK